MTTPNLHRLRHPVLLVKGYPPNGDAYFGDDPSYLLEEAHYIGETCPWLEEGSLHLFYCDGDIIGVQADREVE